MSGQELCSPSLSFKEKAGIWVLTFRPKTLPMSFVPVLVGSGLALAQFGHLQTSIAILCVLVSILIQTGINLTNDAIDAKRGADGDNRLGPRRAIQRGIASNRTILGLGIGCFMAALALGIPLMQQGGWVVEIILLAAVGLGYMYTGGPYSLAYLGLGDLFVLLFFGLINTSTVYYLQGGALGGPILLAGLQVGLLAIAPLIINNLRDREEDAKNCKKTLAVRFGVQFSRWEMFFVTLFPFVLGLQWVNWGFPFAAWFPFAIFPLAWQNGWNIWTTPPSTAYNIFLARSGLTQLLFGALLTMGYLWT